MVFGSWVPPTPARSSPSSFIFHMTRASGSGGKAGAARRGENVTPGLRCYQHFCQEFAHLYNEQLAKTHSSGRGMEQSPTCGEKAAGHVGEMLPSACCPHEAKDLLPVLGDLCIRGSSSRSCTAEDILQEFVDVMDEGSMGARSDDDQSLSPRSPFMPTDCYQQSLSKYCSHDEVLFEDLCERQETVSFRDHQRKISRKIHQFVHRVSGLASPRPRSTTASTPKSPSEVFRTSLLEATSQRDSFIDAYH